MAAFGDGFELSKWFNNASMRQESAASDNTDGEDVEGAVVVLDDSEPVAAVEMTHCFVCKTPNPEYLSTNTVKGAPSVPVCSLECEADYLKQKGWNASKKDGGKYVQLPPTSPSSTTDALGQPPSKKAKRDTSGDRTEAMPDEATTKRPRRSFSFLDDHMLDAEDGKGYKSWWLGALAFYDFVYQRHGMWHSYSIEPNGVPRVDPSLIKYCTSFCWRVFFLHGALTVYVLNGQGRATSTASLIAVLHICGSTPCGAFTHVIFLEPSVH
jgi:hypothetical protein